MSKQKHFYIEGSDLREKFKSQTQGRVSSMCKAIGQHTQTKIDVQVMPNKTVRIEVIGKRVEKAREYLLHEICEPKSYAKHGLKEEQKTRPRSSQRAQQIMSEEDQDKLLKRGIQKFLLTKANLAKHDLLTNPSELRQFACGPCDHFWWKVVLVSKRVSKCHKCHFKYNALERDKEFGIGRFMCQNETCIQRTFYARCHAKSKLRCRNCNSLVQSPYIHPKFLKSNKKRQPLDPNATPFVPPRPQRSHRPQPPSHTIPPLMINMFPAVSHLPAPMPVHIQPPLPKSAIATQQNPPTQQTIAAQPPSTTQPSKLTTTTKSQATVKPVSTATLNPPKKSATTVQLDASAQQSAATKQHTLTQPAAPVQPPRQVPIPYNKKKRVINASTPHLSSGSTIDTFLTQSVVSFQAVSLAAYPNSDDEISLPSDDSDTSSDGGDTTYSTEVPSDVDRSECESTSMNLSGSDSEDDDHHRRHRKRREASSSSDESSDSENSNKAEVGSDEHSSQASTTLDSGLGTASNGETQSSMDSAKPVSVESPPQERSMCEGSASSEKVASL